MKADITVGLIIIMCLMTLHYVLLKKNLDEIKYKINEVICVAEEKDLDRISLQFDEPQETYPLGS